MRILIIKLSSIGDLNHALPAVHGLKTGLGAEIDWVVHKEYVDLVGCFTDVSRVIPFYRKSFFSNLPAFLRDLRASEYDYIVDLQGLLKSAMVASLARGRNRIGPSFFREGAGLFYSAIAGKRNKGRHAVEECMDVVRFLGLKEVAPEFPVRFPRHVLADPHPRVAILPVSRWVTKNWPAACFADVAKRLKAERGATIYLLGGPGDVDACEHIARSVGGKVINLAGKSSIVETGSLLAEMDLLVANDSGPMHMAVSLGVPVLAIYGPTDPVRTGPYGSKNRVMKTTLDCQPCFSDACRRGGIPCLSGVTPENVSALALEMIRRK